MQSKSKRPGSVAFKLLAVLLLGFAAWSQSQAHQLTFEVATIKLTAPETPYSQRLLSPGGRIRLIRYTLKGLIVQAYQMENFQVFGLSSWADNAFYDMDAIAGAGADPKHRPPVPAVLSPPMREMLQALLAERFQLELHRESRPYVSL